MEENWEKYGSRKLLELEEKDDVVGVCLNMYAANNVMLRVGGILGGRLYLVDHKKDNCLTYLFQRLGNYGVDGTLCVEILIENMGKLHPKTSPRR